MREQMKIRHRNESGNKAEMTKEREASADAKSSRGPSPAKASPGKSTDMVACSTLILKF